MLSLAPVGPLILVDAAGSAPLIAVNARGTYAVTWAAGDYSMCSLYAADDQLVRTRTILKGLGPSRVLLNDSDELGIAWEDRRSAYDPIAGYNRTFTTPHIRVYDSAGLFIGQADGIEANGDTGAVCALAPNGNVLALQVNNNRYEDSETVRDESGNPYVIKFWVAESQLHAFGLQDDGANGLAAYEKQLASSKTVERAGVAPGVTYNASDVAWGTNQFLALYKADASIQLASYDSTTRTLGPPFTVGTSSVNGALSAAPGGPVAVLTGANQAICYPGMTAPIDVAPTAAADVRIGSRGDGGFVVTYRDNGQTFVRAFWSDGSEALAATPLDAGSGGYSMAVGVDGDLFVAFEQSGGIHVQRYASPFGPEPDLACTADRSSIAALPGAPVDVAVTVSNNGDAASGPSLMEAYLDAGAQPVASFPVPALAPGQYIIHHVTLAAPAADGALSIIADASDSVSESNELNNTLAVALSIGSYVHGTAYNDANGNGRRDAGEASLDGRTIYVDSYGAGRFIDSRIGATRRLPGPSFAIQSGTYEWDYNTHRGYWTTAQTHGSFTFPAGAGITDSSAITSMSIGFNFEQSAGYINARLTSPSGISVNLFDPLTPGAGWLIFSDTPAAGERSPTEPFTVFHGEKATGKWQLDFFNNNNGVRVSEFFAEFSVATPAPGDARDISAFDGSYAIGGFTAGTYDVGMSAQPGWVRPGAAGGECVPVTIPAGPSAITADFGAYPDGASGKVFYDTNGNGVREGGEAPLAWCDVYIDSNTNGAYDDGEPLTCTDDNGDYFLAGVPAGNHALRVTPPAEGPWQFTSPAAGAKAITTGAGPVAVNFGMRLPTGMTPSLMVATDGGDISWGSTTPDANLGTDYGSVAIGALAEASFDLQNLGDDPLMLSGLAPITISGPDAGDFALVMSPCNAIGGGCVSTFILAFSPHGLGRRSATMTIASNDPAHPAYSFAVGGSGANPSLIVVDSQAVATEGDPAGCALGVMLSAPASAPVTVNYATADDTAQAGADYRATSGSLTFAIGEWYKTVIVPIIDDKTTEPEESFRLILSSPSGATVAAAQGRAAIIDNDVPGAVEFSSPTFAVVENDGSATVTVSRPAGTAGPITVDYATSPGTAAADGDYTPCGGTLAFADGQTSQSFTIPILDNYRMDGDRTINLTLSNPTGGATLGATSTAVLTITNDDTAGAIQFASAAFTVDENGGAATVTLTRTGGLAEGITVDYATSDGTATAGAHYTSRSGTLTFAGAQSTQSFTIPILDNAVPNLDRTINLTLANPTGGATLGAISAAALTIINDDVPAISISAPAPVQEGDSGTTAAVFTVTLSQPGVMPVTVHYSTSSGTAIVGSDFAADDDVLTIPADATSATITIQVIGDTASEANETFSVNLSSPTRATLAQSQATAVIANDDVDTVAPTATLAKVIAPKAGSRTCAFTVTYSDNAALNAATIGTGDILITGPARFRQTAKLTQRIVSGQSIFATYQFTAPGGKWDKADNGVYSIVLQALHVADLAGLFARSRTLGKLTAKLK